MKKIFFIVICLLFLLLWVACGKEPIAKESTNEEISTNESLTVSSPFAESTTAFDLTEPILSTMEYVTREPSTNKNGLPEYVPGSIKLDTENNDYFEYKRNYRMVFYAIDTIYTDMVNREAFNEWSNLPENQYSSKERTEMWLVSFIRHFNISKDEFTKVTKKLMQANLNAGNDIYSENNEIPNADIIYTFDNEIINRYYRYE